MLSVSGLSGPDASRNLTPRSCSIASFPPNPIRLVITVLPRAFARAVESKSELSTQVAILLALLSVIITTALRVLRRPLRHDKPTFKPSGTTARVPRSMSVQESRIADAFEIRDHDVSVNEQDHLDVTLIRPRRGAGDNNKLVIFTHPWSRLGGQKHDPVIEMASRIFLNAGYSAIQYNCRGVGESSGSASFTGFPEAEDLEQLTRWGCETVGNVDTIVLFGYSFGSLVTSLCPIPSTFLPAEYAVRRIGYILLSHPLGVSMWLTLFNHKRYEAALQTLVSSPPPSGPSPDVLFLYGAQDTFTSNSRYTRCVENLKSVRAQQNQVSGESTSNQNGLGSFQATAIEGAGHFWHGESGRELREVVKDWLGKFEAERSERV